MACIPNKKSNDLEIEPICLKYRPNKRILLFTCPDCYVAKRNKHYRLLNEPFLLYCDNCEYWYAVVFRK